MQSTVNNLRLKSVLYLNLLLTLKGGSELGRAKLLWHL